MEEWAIIQNVDIFVVFRIRVRIWKFIFFELSSIFERCLAAPQWSDLTREIALESDRRLMSDQEQSVLIDQLLSDVKRLKRENQVISDQFFNFVEEEQVSW